MPPPPKVPVYSLNGFLALRFRHNRIWFDLPRECYEAYVIYSFYMYLIQFLEDEYTDVPKLLAEKPPMRHLFPCNFFFKRWEMGEEFLRHCKSGILNYVILRPLMTAIAFITALGGCYNEGIIRADNSYIYVSVVNNFSQCWSLYCLLLVYLALHEDLAPIQPFWKFASIKLVVFFSFWQGLAISILIKIGLLTDEDAWLQDLAICIEMFFAAYMLCVAFPSKDYEDDEKRLLSTKFDSVFNVEDVVEDVKENIGEHITWVAGTVKGTVSTVGTTLGAAGRVVLRRGPGSSGESSPEPAPALGNGRLSPHVFVPPPASESLPPDED